MRTRRLVNRVQLTLRLGFAIVLMSLTLIQAGVVLAHASLVRADPSPNSVLDQSPGKVVCWFSEPVEAEYSNIELLNSQGVEVDNRDSKIDPNDPTSLSVTLPPLPNDIYTVVWTTVSASDGHSVRNSFLFSVGQPLTNVTLASAPQEPPLQSVVEPILKWSSLLSILAAVGGLIFEFLIWRPVLDGAQSNLTQRQLPQRLASRTRKLEWWALLVFLIVSVAQLFVQTMIAYNMSPFQVFGSPMTVLITDTAWGQVWQWRIILLGMTAISLRVLFGWENPPYHHMGLAASFLFGCGVLLTLSLASHAAGVPDNHPLAIIDDFLHLLAAAFWVGGLFHFALVLPVIKKNLQPEETRAILAAIVPRFSHLAGTSVTALIVTGLYSYAIQVGSLQGLTTPYGKVLLVKVALVLPLLALGGLNLLWVSRLLKKNTTGVKWLTRFVRMEAMLAVLVLLITGIMTNMETARQQQTSVTATSQKQINLDYSANGVHVAMAITPGRLGSNKVTITLTDARFGKPIANASDVTLILLNQDHNIITPASIVNHGGGVWVVDNAVFSITGNWQALLTIQRPDNFDAQATFQFTIAGQ